MTKKYVIGFIDACMSYLVGSQKQLDWIPDAEEIWDIDQLQADPRPKILMVPAFNPGGEFPCQGDYSWATLIIAAADEFLVLTPDDTILAQAQKALNNRNIIFVVGGLVPEMINSNRIYHPRTLNITNTVDSNNYIPSQLPAKKPYLFDAMLGQIKEHRLFIFYKLIEDNLLDNSLVSLWRHYHQPWADLTKSEIEQKLINNYSHSPICGDLIKKHGLIPFYRSPGLNELELPDIPYPVDDPVNYFSTKATTRFRKPDNLTHWKMGSEYSKVTMAADIPINIYDASWYSIVAETRYESNHVFISEKLSKPLLAKRVFVVFGAQGCLQYLRSQGFQTFDGIIDESYDSELDDRKRFDMAWEQVKLLSTLDPVEVYQRANSILEHNYNLTPTLVSENLKIRNFIAQWLPRSTKKYALGIIHPDSSWYTGERYNLSWIPDAERINDLDQLQADQRPKILMVPVFNPGGEFPCQGDYSWATLIVGVTSEMCNFSITDAQTAVNNQNVIFISGDKSNNLYNDVRVYAPLMYWVSQTFENNHYVPTTLPDKKPYLFDALLGFNKINRVYIFYKLFEDGLLDRSLVSIWRLNEHTSIAESDEQFYKYFLNDPVTKDLVQKYGTLDGRINFYRSPELDQLELPEVPYPKDDPLNYTSMQPTARRNRDRPNDPLYLSQEIPTRIYDASWYSIVGETTCNNNHVFITEKTGKALLAKRVFVMFGGQGCLQYLRSQGFQTFDGIIDESYDSEPNNRRRFDMAWEQVKLLSTLDPVEVYQRANSILEHNYNLLPTLRNEHLQIRDFIAQWLPQ